MPETRTQNPNEFPNTWREISRTEVPESEMILKDNSRFEGPEWEVVAEGPSAVIGELDQTHTLSRRYRVRKFKSRDEFCSQELPYEQHDLNIENPKKSEF